MVDPMFQQGWLEEPRWRQVYQPSLSDYASAAAVRESIHDGDFSTGTSRTAKVAMSADCAMFVREPSS